METVHEEMMTKEYGIFAIL